MGSIDSALDNLNARLVLFGGAAIALQGVLLSAMGAVDDRLSPSRRAVAHAVPIAAVVLLLVWMGKFEIATAILFGSTVAILSAVIGFLALAGSPGSMPARYRTAWVFLPVAGVLAFISGFTGEFTWSQAIVLVAEGALLLWVRAESSDAAAIDHPKMPMLSWRAVALMILGAVAALAGGYLALHGAERIQRNDADFPLSATVGIFLSVILALPLIHSGSRLAERGEGWSPMSSAVGVALINLCGTLPAAIVIAKLRHAGLHLVEHWPMLTPLSTTYFLPGIWRVDAVLIVLLSILLAPVGAGRLKVDRVFGGLLIFVYCAYLLASILSMAGDARWGWLPRGF